jgi:drug/metabolite transporter (DMT)-like permease
MLDKYSAIFLFSVFIASCAQIMLKISADKGHAGHIREYINPWVMGAYTILFASTILTVIAFRGVELKYGPILESFGYIYVLLLSWILLKEKATPNKIAGIALIIAGVCLFGT